ncbi:hypothetical protein Tco_0452590 [Tanacetum coccineum]
MGLKAVQYGVSNGFDMAYREFLGVGTTFDIFQNIHILYLIYGVLVFWIRRIDLVSFVVFDYAGCNLDRKSTSRVYQILGRKLVCWSAKKQSYVAMLSVEAEYVDVAG